VKAYRNIQDHGEGLPHSALNEPLPMNEIVNWWMPILSFCCRKSYS